MFDNVAFDVVLGLVLVYLLYSLLTTLVGEMIASRLGIRQKLLRFSIERMLNDGASRNPSWWGRMMIYPKPGFDTTLAGKFYAYPSIKYLSRQNSGRSRYKIPSYITGEYFADALIHFLAENGAGDTIMQQVRFCLRFNTLQIDPETIKHIRNLYNDSFGRQEVFQGKLTAWFNEMQDRNNGWYKNKVRVILFLFGLFVAILFNVDSIRIARILAIDKQARTQLTNMGIAIARDSTRYKDLRDASPNPFDNAPMSNAVMDSGLSHVSSDIRAANHILGLGWDFSDKPVPFDVEIASSDKPEQYSSIQQAVRNFKKVNKKSFSQAAVDTLAADVQADLDFILNSKVRVDSLDMEVVRAGGKRPDSVPGHPFHRFPDEIQRINDLMKARDKAQDNLGADSVRYRSHLFLYTYARLGFQRGVHLIGSLTKKDYLRIDSVTVSSNSLTIHGQREYCLPAKLGYILWRSFFSASLFGFLLTALALSLGAPFWFDLLNKLVSIRGSGVKPEEKKSPKPGPGSPGGSLAGSGNATNPDPNPTPVFATPPDPGSNPEDASIQAALDVYGAAIKQEPGVLSAHKGYSLTGVKPVDCLQVNVMNATTKANVEKKFGGLELFKHVLLNVDVTGKPKLLAGTTPPPGENPARALRNQSELFGWGSFGCLMFNNQHSDQKYIITCYHVANGDLNWKNMGNNRTIKNNIRNISNNYQGCLNSRMDAASIGPIDNSVYKTYKPFRPKGKTQIGPADVTNKKKISVVGLTSSAKGFIIHHNCPASFDYQISDDTVQPNPMTGLVAVSHFDENNKLSSISKGGDSGALVVDEEGKAIGIIVGDDDKQTYVIPIDVIEQQFNQSLDS